MDHEFVVSVNLTDEQANLSVRVPATVVCKPHEQLYKYLDAACQEFYGQRFQVILQWRDLTAERLAQDPESARIIAKAEALHCSIQLAAYILALEERISNLECH